MALLKMRELNVAAPGYVSAPLSPAQYAAKSLALYAATLWARLLDARPAISLSFLCYVVGLAAFNVVPALQGAAPVLGPRLAAVLMVTAVLAGLACFYLAACDTAPRWLYRMWPHCHVPLLGAVSVTLAATGLSLGVLAALPLTILQPHHYGNDAVAATECATHLFLQGHNPYATFNLVDCFARHGLTGIYTTPLQAGAFAHIRVYPPQPELLRAFAQVRHARVAHPAMFESYLSYPAGAFLLTAPFAALGWHDLSTFYLLWAVLAYGLLLWRAPWGWRPWVLVLAGANATLWTTIGDGQSNVLDVLLIVAAWATWQRSWLSAVLMGAAVATRQEAWLFAPFYLVLAGRLQGWRSATIRLAIIAGIFGLSNAPFLALSPRAWLHGILGPLTDPMFPLGQGVIALATSGVLPLWPHYVYSGLQLAALVACLLLYLRLCRRQPGTGPVLALVPVVFAWRSLFTYFYVALPLLALWAFLDALSARCSEQLTPAARPGLQHDPASARGFGGAAWSGGPTRARPAGVSPILCAPDYENERGDRAEQATAA